LRREEKRKKEEGTEVRREKKKSRDGVRKIDKRRE